MASKTPKISPEERKRLKEMIKKDTSRKKPNEPDLDELNDALENHGSFRKKAEESIQQEAQNETPVNNIDGTGNLNQPNPPVDTEKDYDFEEPEDDGDPNAIPEDDINPLEEKVHINEYNNSNAPVNPTAQPEVERIIPEPIVNTSTINPDAKKDEGDGSAQPKTEKPKEEPKPEKPRLNPDFDEISPSERRKNAEKDADAIVTTWANFLPAIPKRMAKFNMAKLDLLEMQGEIVMSQQVLDDGTTFRGYCEGVNTRVDETFVYTEEMRQSIKEPLVEVLLEEGIAMTPKQRLVKVAIEQALQFGAAAFEMMMDNRNALNQMKEFMKQQKAGGNSNQSPPPQNTQPDPPPKRPVAPQYERQEQEEVVYETKKSKEVQNPMSMEDILSVNDNSITVEEIIPEDENEQPE